MTRPAAGGVPAAPLWVAVLAVAAILGALWRLTGATAPPPVATERAVIAGGIPLTVFRPAPATDAAPVVVIAHGFAGSQQLMRPFAATLVRHGLIAVTFDFPGHGRNPTPLAGGLTDDRAASAALLGALAAVEAHARGLAGADAGRLALLGHSMGADIVLRHAVARGEAIAATVAVSTFGPAVTATRPRNLLSIVGGLEPAPLHEEAARMVALALPPGSAVAEDVTYGRFEDGTARRLVVSRGVEHIGVLYGGDGLLAALTWLDAAFGRGVREVAFLDTRGPWIGLLALGLVALGWPLARLLPRAVAGAGEGAAGVGAALPWRRLWPAVLLPAVATPVLLRLVPTETLPLLLGDYMLAHFALYGALTVLMLRVAGAASPFAGGPANRTAWGAALFGGGCVAVYGILAIGLPLDAEVVAFWPVGARWWLVPAMFAGTLIWFLADEWAVRGGARGAYAATKLCFLVSLAIAIALDLHRLFFLIIILPVILVLFLAYGLFGRWAWRATGHPFVAAIGNAAMLAWAIGTIFPLVAR